MKQDLSMRFPAKYLSFHSLTLLSIGLSFGIALGWWMGHATKVGTGESAGTKSEQIQITHGGNGRRPSTDNPDSTGDRQIRRTATFRQDSDDLNRSVRAIFQENVKSRRIARFEKLIERTPVDRLPELIALIRENDLQGNDSGEEWTRVWTSWAERDPQAAMDFLTTHDWTGWNDVALGEARNRTLAAWAHADPEKARRFVETDPDFMNGDRSLVFGLVEGWANADPAAAADWLFQNRLGSNAEYEKIAAALRRKGGQDGLDSWFFGLDPSTVPDRGKTAFARSMTPAKTAEWISQRSGETWIKDSEMVSEAARVYAQQDPKGAVLWAAGTGLEDAMHFSISVWCEKDIEAAGAWVKENAGHPQSYQAAAVVIAHLRQKDPAAARAWADSVTDPSLRERLR